MDERGVRLLLIDADPAGHARIERLLVEIGDPALQLDWSVDLASASRDIERGEYDLYLIDLGLAYENCFGLIRELRDAPGQPAIILLSGSGDAAATQRAMQSGAADCLDRLALDAGMLERSLRYALERRRLQRELERERYLLHALMDHLPDNIYFKDINSRFLRVSRELAQRFGLTDPQDAVSLSDADFFTAEHAVQAREDEIELMRTGEPILRKEEKETWPNGRVTWVTSSKLPLQDRHGRVVGTFGMSRDITHQKQVELELVQAKEAAETASRAKSTFLATMSHEIRTPLNAVIAVADLLQETPLTPEQREYLAMVQESGESLLTIIEDILDFSKIEAGRIDLDQVDFNLRDRISDALRCLSLRADRKELKLAWHVPAEVPATLRGDPGRLRQVIVNLVNNAIKFTDQGEVVLEVWPESTSPHGVLLHFAVRDTGIGIPPDKLTTVFEAFEQIDNSGARRYEGTGLGLAICWRLVELMGGRIWVESVLGRGSTFHFTARFALTQQEFPVAPMPRKSPTPGTTPSMRILLAEDSVINQRLAVGLLERAGHRVCVVPNGRDAVLATAQECFDLVLMDLQMPEMDGLTATAAIRQREKQTGRHVPIVAMTAHALKGDQEICLAAGMDGYLPKPMRLAELQQAIADVQLDAQPDQVLPDVAVRAGAS